MKRVDQKVYDQFRSVRCPEHGQTATIHRTANGWDIRGCCDTLRTLVRERLQFR